MERQTERPMTAVDKQEYLKNVQDRILDPEVVELVRSDLEFGLTAGEIDDYTDRGLDLAQMKAVSAMYRSRIPRQVVAAIGNRKYNAEKMRLAAELYQKKIPAEEIEMALEDSATALDMRKAFDLALGRAQTAIAVSEESIKKEPLESREAKELTEMIRSLTDVLKSSKGNYDAISKMLESMEKIRLDEAVAKNLTLLNEKLEKENRGLAKQLGDKQDEVNQGLQSIARLRNDKDNLKKEMKTMQDRIDELDAAAARRDETIREQGQAIKAKDSAIRGMREKEKASPEGDGSTETAADAEHALPDAVADGKEEMASVSGSSAAYMGGNGMPVYYAVTLVQDGQVTGRADIEYTERKPSVFTGIMNRLAFKKKSHRNFVQMMIDKQLSPEQVNAIRTGLEKGLNEEQLELIINKELAPEKIQSIVVFAALQNSLKAGRGEKA